MAHSPSRSAWHARLLLGAADSLVPFAVAATILGVAVAVWAVSGLAAPAWRGPAVLGATSLAFSLAFVARPKPTLVVFALFVLYYHTLARWMVSDLRHVDEIVVPVLFAVTAWRCRPWQRELIAPLRDGAVLLMLVAGVVSSVIAAVPLDVWLLGLLLLAKVFAFLYIVAWHDFTPADVRQAYPLVLGLALVTLALSAWEIVDTPGFRAALNVTNISVPREGLPSIKSVFAHPVLFAWFNAFTALFLLAGHVFLRRRWLLIVAALFGVGTTLAGRRRAIAGVAVALLGGVAVTAARSPGLRPALRQWWPALATAALVAIVFLPSLLGLLRLTVDETAPDPAAGGGNARIALYQTSVAIAVDRFPLGVGLGRYGSAVSRNPYSPVYVEYGLDTVPGLMPNGSQYATDTFWPRILGETGILGLAALLVFTALLTRDVWRATRLEMNDALAAAFVLGAWLVLMQGLVETLASSLFDAPPRSYLLFGALGMALSLARGTISRPVAEPAITPAA